MNIIKKNVKTYKQILKTIKKYSTIVVYRHQMPDFDASGCQNGFVTWLKDSFPMKNIFSAGKDFIDFTPRLYPSIPSLDTSKLGDYLAIVLDTGNTKRIDDDSYQNASMIIKIDHHPAVENYGNINLVNDELASCSELLVDFVYWCQKKYPLSMLAAKYFFSGIVGDSGRFLYSSTNIHTFEAAEYCLSTGFNPSRDVYQIMYEKDVKDLDVLKYLLNNYKLSEKGVAYYILDNQTLNKLGLRPEQGKNQMSTFSNMKGIEIWVAISEDINENVWRVSIRSKNIAINEVARKYRGGGHDQASGAKLESLDEVPLMIKDLEELIK